MKRFRDVLRLTLKMQTPDVSAEIATLPDLAGYGTVAKTIEAGNICKLRVAA